MANIITYKQIVGLLEDFARRDYQLNTFILSRDWEFENNEDIIYPCLLVHLDSARLPSSSLGAYPTIEIRVRCKVLDLLSQDKSNLTDVHNDTLRIATDLVNELNVHPYFSRSNATLIGDVDFTPLEEFEDDFAGGQEFSLTIQLLNNNCFEGLPIEDITGYSAAGAVYTGYSTTVQYLTTGSSQFQDYISNALAGVETDNYYTTGATFSGGELAFNRNDELNAYAVTIDGRYLPLAGGRMVGTIQMNPLTAIDFYDTNNVLQAGLVWWANVLYFLQNAANQRLRIAFDYIDLYSNNNTIGLSTYISTTASAITVGSSVGNFSGITYASDLTSKFQNESLITKRYVDARIATATTTGNYLSLSGGSVSGETNFTSLSATTYLGVPTIFGCGADNNGGTIASGVCGYFVAGHSGTITGWDLIGATSGTIIFDVWKTTGSTLPTVSNSICGTSKPRITAGVYSGSTNLSAWSGLTYSSGDKFGFNIDSVTGFTNVSLTIKGTKS